MENTFGVVAFDSNKKIIGVCSSVSDFDNFHEINIEVNKNNRRQGIGYVAAYGFIQECYKRGKNSYWDCLDQNQPSRALSKNQILLKSIVTFLYLRFIPEKSSD